MDNVTISSRWIKSFVVQNSDVIIRNDFNIPIINILWQLVAGYRFEKDNSNVKNITEVFQHGIKIHFIPFPILKVSGSRTPDSPILHFLAVSQCDWLQEEEGNHQRTKRVLHIGDCEAPAEPGYI